VSGQPASTRTAAAPPRPATAILGPRGLPLLASGRQLVRDPLGTYRRAMQTHGDLVRPLFTRQRIAGYATVMAEEPTRLLQGWAAPFASGRPVNLHRQMTGYTLRVLGRLLAARPHPAGRWDHPAPRRRPLLPAAPPHRRPPQPDMTPRRLAMRTKLALATVLALLVSGAMVASVAAAAPAGGSSTLRPWGRGQAAAAAAGEAAATQATQAGATRLVVIGREADFTIVDNAPEGDSPGDQILFTDNLSDPSGRRIGRDEARCTIMFRGDVLCDATFVLAGQGQLTIEGVGLTFAVTGGTGRFHKARGHMQETFLPSGEFRFAFTLYI
jgi:hypothetical protein